MAKITYKGADLNIGSESSQWFNVAGIKDIEVTLSIDTSAFDDAVDHLTGKKGCPELCRKCGVVQCIGKNPHAERFGPFHVFPQHDDFVLS